MRFPGKVEAALLLMKDVPYLTNSDTERLPIHGRTWKWLEFHRLIVSDQGRVSLTQYGIRAAELAAASLAKRLNHE